MNTEEIKHYADYLKSHPEEAQILIDCFDDCIGTISNMIRNNSDNKDVVHNKDE